MKKTIIQLLNNQTFLIIATLLSSLMLSPKWFLTGALWFSSFFALRYFRKANLKQYIYGWLSLSAVTIISQLDVMPMPLVMMAPLLLIANLFGLLPYLLDRWILNKVANDQIAARISTLAILLSFPVFNTVMQIFMDMGPQGTWGNPIYTQYHFSSFIQFASVAGIYGLNFIVAWFGTTLNYIVDHKIQAKSYARVLASFTSVIIIILGFGFYQLYNSSSEQNAVRVSTIALDNTTVLEEAYRLKTDMETDIAKNTNFTDTILVTASSGLMDFVSNPQDPSYTSLQIVIDNLMNNYMEESEKAASAGAKIIAWPEAAIIATEQTAEANADRISQFAATHGVYIFYPTAVFLSDQVGKSDKFIENKILTFDPNGDLINTYFKNIPVPGVEASIPGDGVMPIIETPYGNLTPAICYDLDFPNLILQTGQKKADMIVAPTGDWHAISPYHTYQAAFRCIENGTNMMKPVVGGLSAIINTKGLITNRASYYDEDPAIIISDIAVNSEDTLFATIGISIIIFFQMAFLAIIIMLSYIEVSSALKKFTLRGTVA